MEYIVRKVRPDYHPYPWAVIERSTNMIEGYYATELGAKKALNRMGGKKNDR